MPRFKNVNGERVQFTEAEEAARDAEEAAVQAEQAQRDADHAAMKSQVAIDAIAIEGILGISIERLRNVIQN